jgi:transposase-like protein
MNGMKNKCPRCHSSMLLDYSDTVDGYQPTWKCLGCGRELFMDAERQAQDEQLLEGIRAEKTPSARR